ncbi:hypothetical protein METBIDRAFT_121489 [Metschnikowia bicuspidata var. bicuspidata NRRL YB-4993]|uniref:Uncharacterized protein n=1 Tax=Metschnikowia bicuspidata var. bicuspidata NRRL YB-4993 TaxID=869754 RepID=A0A1A0HJQ1_9ASCO|nr:hypothetical protein METBIDRAFT_121489 [Metschnikowia bicuspidata var. bicuspidata NRRL YB-4993]OBA24245.1 hypothetical protein METBIDRAFT_121489 [Metschnikowia bicuspidata var. bicuspidata NRRL YB-4993]
MGPVRVPQWGTTIARSPMPSWRRPDLPSRKKSSECPLLSPCAASPWRPVLQPPESPVTCPISWPRPARCSLATQGRASGASRPAHGRPAPVGPGGSHYTSAADGQAFPFLLAAHGIFKFGPSEDAWPRRLGVCSLIFQKWEGSFFLLLFSANRPGIVDTLRCTLFRVRKADYLLCSAAPQLPRAARPGKNNQAPSSLNTSRALFLGATARIPDDKKTGHPHFRPRRFHEDFRYAGKD